MDSGEEPELPLESAPAINWRAVRRRAYLLITAPKIPAWLVILLLVLKEIPDWKSRYDFWVSAAKSLGGFPGMIASVIGSGYFTPIAAVTAAAYIILVGEPKKGVQRHHWWPYIGWSVFGTLVTVMVVTGIVGYVEIYIKTEVSKRDDEIQKQSAVRPVFWHLTDLQKTSLAHVLDKVPEDKRFPIQVRCLPDAGSRTYVEDLAKVFIDHQWKFTANCLFSNVRPDLVGVYIGVAKKFEGKNIEELPDHDRMMGTILNEAHIPAQWSLDRDDSLGDEPTLVVGNAP
jgi:hypothetical protein